MAHQSSNCPDDNNLQSTNFLGAIFRKYGEAYIEQYCPSLRKIKLIRNIRKCRTPAMGAVVLICKGCKEKKWIYKSCGDGKCPVCQGVKRMKVREKISAKMLAVPYVHTVFTLPHQLNALLRANSKVLFDLLYQSAWQCIKNLCKSPENLGAQPGMISLMHTWGSDMKYHVHLHTLITFGGLDKQNKWHFPKRKDKLAGYRAMSKEFRRIYLAGILKLQRQGKLKEVPFMEATLAELAQKRWVIHNTKPQVNTKVIEEYLARYIMRIAVSNNRISLDEAKDKVHLIYNNYRQQVAGEAAPKAIKIFDPLSFIHQFMQHLPPPNFQRLRYYGLHSSSIYKRIKKQIPNQLKRNGNTVKTIFKIVKALLGLNPIVCKNCEGVDFEKSALAPDPAWLLNNVRGYFPKKKKSRSPPQNKHICLLQ